LHPSF